MTIDTDDGVFAEDAAALHALVPSTPAKHIAVFIYALTGGGAQRRTVTLANGFAECGHDVDLVTAGAPVAVQDGETLGRQPLAGQLLTRFPHRVVMCHPLFCGPRVTRLPGTA